MLRRIDLRIASSSCYIDSIYDNFHMFIALRLFDTCDRMILTYLLPHGTRLRRELTVKAPSNLRL
jgi:hypothetical protein